MAQLRKSDFQNFLEYNKESSTLLRKQAMVNNEFLSDVVFLVGPDRQRIYAHKMLLTISSEYFYIMFFGSFVEASEKEVVLANDDPDMFLLIMRYIYSGEIDLTFENMRDIFNIAQKFMLNELITLICNFILRHIEAESTLRLFSENRHYGFASVDDKCLEMISNNP
uniref:BTB domain-containing protein n=1 Tax=Anopheles atroparvus TaxID=41427 RepID=A0AAG5DP93_ANOAO